MPNVAGVSFDYTPEGMRAAEEYRRSLSPRRRNMGFRPLGMQEGGAVGDIYFEFSDHLENMTAPDLRNWILNHSAQLDMAVEGNPRREDQLRDAKSWSVQGLKNPDGSQMTWEQHFRSLFESPDPVVPIDPLVTTGLGNRIAGEILQPPSGIPSFPGYEVETGDYYPPQVEQNSTDLRNRKFSYPLASQGMARGGVPRGTVAGELRPRGYMTAREAGETMRELSKRHDDERSYGGGIASLYTRRG